MQKVIFPLGCTVCSLDRIRPVSGVRVVRTSQLLEEKQSRGSAESLRAEGGVLGPRSPPTSSAGGSRPAVLG